MKRIASIDIGTNTILMLVADVASDGRVTVVRDEHSIARLGRGVDSARRIVPETVDRVMGVLRSYLEIARTAGAERVVACGTSALRDAANRDEVLQSIRDRIGMDVRILSGDEEAHLTYFGTISPLKQEATQGAFGVIDIGGGSTEITSGTPDRIMYRRSCDVGSVRLTERWWKIYPPLEESVAAAKKDIHRAFRDVRPDTGSATWVGVAGTLTTCAAIDLKLEQFDRTGVDGYILKKETVDRILGDLMSMSLEQLQHHPQIHPQRADIISAGVLILEAVMEVLGLQSIMVSDRGLRYGMLMDAAGGMAHN